MNPVNVAIYNEDNKVMASEASVAIAPTWTSYEAVAPS